MAAPGAMASSPSHPSITTAHLRAREHAPPAPAPHVELYRYEQPASSGPAGGMPAAPAGSGPGHAPHPVRMATTAAALASDPIAGRAFSTAQAVDSYLASRFHRNGVDGHGGALKVVVHAPDADNAYWVQDKHRIELGDGDGDIFSPLGDSRSVVAHEVYHGVIASEVRLDYSRPQEAALHESMADVFAAGMTGTWRIGEDVYTPKVPGDAIRDLEHPQLGDWRTASHNAEAHALAGIPSLAAVRSAKAIGMDAMQDVWYHGLVDHLADHATFEQAAQATIAAAGDLYGAHSPQQDAVAQAWQSVGVEPRKGGS